MIRSFAAAGAGILAGSDATDWEPYLYAGSSLHEELVLLVDAGLTPLQALRSATSDPARFLGRKDLGVIEPGALADLVLLAADPLADIRNISAIDAVIFDGRPQTRPDLDALLADAELRAAQGK